jgi:hypothetical protein
MNLQLDEIDARGAFRHRMFHGRVFTHEEKCRSSSGTGIRQCRRLL